MNPFEVLGLDEQADAREIKRAYAAAVRVTRPDQDPEQFQRVNEAYRAALELQQQRGDVRGAHALPVGAVRTGWSSGPISIDPTQASPAATTATLAESVSLAQMVVAVFEAASTQPAATFAQWLQRYTPLYSLQRKTDVAIALVRKLVLQADSALSPAALDAIADFFDLGSVGNYPAPVQSAFQSLRLFAHFDYERFQAELIAQSRDQSLYRVHAWLRSQHALNDRGVRDYVGQRLHVWLWLDDTPYLSSPILDLLGSLFGYEDSTQLQARSTARWSIESENTGHLGENAKWPIRQLKRRFGLPRALAIAVIPEWSRRVARLAHRLSQRYGERPSQLNAAQCEFFLQVARKSYFGRWRWVVAALRAIVPALGVLLLGRLLLGEYPLDAGLWFLSIGAIVGATTIGFDAINAWRDRRQAARQAAAAPTPAR
ncbi:J domain-containing protein [Lysobacter sp. Root983]|uniref:J domain-containing protein n=1 Tax=Lysobacter sp. Root983 TaxID=1736613 RepID=UPI00070E8744|nr:J domain-containing protein [Lysobacter sp. Root983]KRD74491.1 hypothetical protein ASE43_14705 [Lysobacter sp. Root983]